MIMTADPTPARQTRDYPRDAVLTIKEVAAGLGVSVRTVERMDLPTFYLSSGRKARRRYHWGQVLDFIVERSK